MGVMFQWKERCVGGKCRGKGGAFLVQAQKEQKGCVALGAYFPLGIEPSTWKQKAPLPQPRWGMDVLGLCSFWGCRLGSSDSPWPGALGELCSLPKIKFMDATRLGLFNLVLILKQELRVHCQRLLHHMDSSMKSDWCPAPAE